MKKLSYDEFIRVLKDRKFELNLGLQSKQISEDELFRLLESIIYDRNEIIEMNIDYLQKVFYNVDNKELLKLLNKHIDNVINKRKIGECEICGCYCYSGATMEIQRQKKIFYDNIKTFGRNANNWNSKICTECSNHEFAECHECGTRRKIKFLRKNKDGDLVCRACNNIK